MAAPPPTLENFSKVSHFRHKSAIDFVVPKASAHREVILRFYHPRWQLKMIWNLKPTKKQLSLTFHLELN